MVQNSLKDEFNFKMLKLTDHGKAFDRPNMHRFSRVSTWSWLVEQEAREILTNGGVPGLIGGDHSFAVGSIAAASKFARGALSVIWFDAHADINSPETSPSGNMHGMPVWQLITKGLIGPNDIVYVGLRSVDSGEAQFIKHRGIKYFTMDEFNADPRGVVKRAYASLPCSSHVHVSFDIDFFDPQVAPGVGTPEIDGATDISLDWLDEIPVVHSFDVVELSPVYDKGLLTAELACNVVRKLAHKGKPYARD